MMALRILPGAVTRRLRFTQIGAPAADFADPLDVFFLTLPPGVEAPTKITIPADKSEVTATLVGDARRPRPATSFTSTRARTPEWPRA